MTLRFVRFEKKLFVLDLEIFFSVYLVIFCLRHVLVECEAKDILVPECGLLKVLLCVWSRFIRTDLSLRCTVTP